MAPSVFLVESPLQALAAREALQAWSLDVSRSTLVVLEPSGGHERRQLERVVDMGGWERVETYPPPLGLSGAVSRLHAIRRIAHANRGAETVFIGDYCSLPMRHVARLASRAETVLLDDGSITLLVDEHRRGRLSPAVARSVNITRSPWSSRTLAARGALLRTPEPDALTFFSVYDLAPRTGDVVVSNRFAWLRSRFAPPRPVAGTLFLGSNFAESGAMDVATYVGLVREALDSCPRPVRYRPHRRESAAKLNTLRDLDLDVTPSDLPVEVGVLTEGSVPEQVASFFSTALDTLPFLLPASVKLRAFTLPPGLLDPAWRPRVAEAYRTLPTRTGRELDVTTLTGAHGA